jgi:hypothetical protein
MPAIKIVLDITRLVEEGKLTAQEAERLHGASNCSGPRSDVLIMHRDPTAGLRNGTGQGLLPDGGAGVAVFGWFGVAVGLGWRGTAFPIFGYSGKFPCCSWLVVDV